MKTPKHAPITARAFVDKDGFKNICCLHREVYQLLQGKVTDGKRKRAIKKLKEAYKSGIKMSEKLHEYAGAEWKPGVYGGK